MAQLAGGLALLGFCLVRVWLHARRQPPAPPAPARPAGRAWPAYAYDLALWGIWLAWAALWWNRGFYPFDHGREATIAHMWLQGVRPYADHLLTHHTLFGVFIHALMEKLFGFTPYAWRLAFVAVYGLCLWLVFRLLCRVSPRRTAWCVSVPLGVFVTNMEMTSYWSYYWNGLLMALLTVLAFSKIPWRGPLAQAAPWLLLTALLAVLSGVAIPQLGLMLQIAFALLAGLRWLDRRERAGVLAKYALLLSASLFFGGLVVGMLHWLGWLPGFQRWLDTLPRAMEVQYQSQSFMDVLGRWRYAFTMSREKNLLVSLAGVAGFTGGLAWLAAWRGRVPSILWRGLSIFYYGIALALVLWCLADPRGCLLFLRAHLLDAPRFIPSLAFALSLALILSLLLSLRRAGEGERQAIHHWLLLLIVGQGIFWSVTQTHPGSSYCMAMSLLSAAAVFTLVWVQAPQRLGLRWPRGMALALALLLGLTGVSYKVLSIPHQVSWWEPFPYFQYPALRHMRDPHAPEMDRALFAARQVVENKGRVLVYPSHITIYPLIGQLPPLPFPDLEHTLYCYPRDPALWAQALAALEQAPPDLLIVQRDILRRQADWQRAVDDHIHTPRVMGQAMQALYAPASGSPYRLELTGSRYYLFRRTPVPAPAP